MSKIYIAEELRSLRTYSVGIDTDPPGPVHSHHGKDFAIGFFDCGAKEIFFKNAYAPVSDRTFRPRLGGDSCPTFDCSIIIAYSLFGAVELVKNWAVNPGAIRFWIIFSGVSPGSNQLRRCAKRLVFLLGAILSDKIIVFSPSYAKALSAKYYVDPVRVVALPVSSDINFFRNTLHYETQLPCSEKIILVVGDITRDDVFIYNALGAEQFSIIRITRDKAVEERVLPYLKVRCRDKILTSVTFEELAFYYRNAAVCVYVSVCDDWQPAGATSIGECLACGGIVLAESGGVIEQDFKLVSPSEPAPIVFFEKRDHEGLRKAVNDLLSKPMAEVANMRRTAAAYAEKNLGVDRTRDIFGGLVQHMIRWRGNIV